MTGWYLSPHIRDLLIVLPVADKGFLVKELGEHGLTAGDLPDPHNAKEWVLAFDSQCMLRQIPGEKVASWLNTSGFPIRPTAVLSPPVVSAPAVDSPDQASKDPVCQFASFLKNHGGSDAIGKAVANFCKKFSGGADIEECTAKTACD